MKKLISILAILMMATASWAEETVWTTVHTAQEFYNAVSTKDGNKKYTANVRLANDIDLSQLSVSGDYVFDFTFEGKIDAYRGQRKLPFSIKNSTRTLFKTLNNATITNLNIVNCSYEGRDTESGQLADEAYGTTLVEVMFQNVEGTGDASTYDCDRMGVAIGTAENCTFKGLFFAKCTLTCDGSYIGCAAGYAKDCTFDKVVVDGACNLWADGNTTSGNSGYVGSLCGYADNCNITFCSNFGLVSSDDDRIGGIIGYGTNGTKLSDCNNAGVVKHCTKDNFGRLVRQKAAIITSYVGSALVGAGTILLGVESYYGSTYDALNVWEAFWDEVDAHLVNGISFENFGYSFVCSAAVIAVVVPHVMIAAGVGCLMVSGFLTVYDILSDPDEIGGIAGTLDGSSCSVLRCVNAGPVECRDCYAGGIVGYMTGSTVENCYNRSFVKGHQYTGGIVGYCNNGTVKNNLSVGMASADDKALGNIIGKVDGTCTRANNYYLSDENKTYDTEIAFTQEKLPSGEIALALNQASGTSLWRQNLGTDFYPIINDAEKPAVTQTTTNYSLEQKVTDASGFYLAAANPFALISIENDINLGNYYYSLASSTYPFKGTIKGNGHRLSCMSHTANPVKDGEENNAALFSFAKGATFENLTIDGFHITQGRKSLDWIKTITEAFLVAQSDECKYNNVKVVNSDILVNEDKDGLWNVGGLVAKSTKDTFLDCTIGANCTLQGYCGVAVALDGTFVGGMAGKATGSTFTRCMNEATIWADDDRNGGIVGYAENCIIDRCLNTGHITAQEYIGGIVGHAKNTVVTHCVNTGVIDDDDAKQESYRSGIVGCLEGSGATVSYCINYGSVNHADADNCSPINNDRRDGATYGEGNYIYCQFNGQPASDNTDVTTQNNMKIGEFALNMKDGEGKHWLYQSLDNYIGFPTNMPVPIPAAGQVYSNKLCDGTQSYSNIYQSAAAHTGVADAYGKCSTCGKVIDGASVATEIHINNANGLNELARNVNSGMDLSGKTVYLDNDIDMSGVSYTPIGKDFNNAFRGAFDGQGHRIKNLSVNVVNGCAGVFGCVSGTTTISNLIIDKTCKINATGYGAAGIVGCMARPEDTEDGAAISLTLSACGNEAAVNGDINAAGLVGGVYNTENGGNATVTITNCYNTGNIKGSGVSHGESAVFIAYGNSNTTVKNCYNTGTIEGHWSTLPLVRVKNKSTILIENTYNLDGLPTQTSDGLYTVTADQVRLGNLCNKLNSGNSSTVWSQSLETDTYPTFGTTGVHYAHTMANEWGTVVLPYDVTYSQNNGNYKLYKLSAASVSGNTGTLTFAEYADGTISAGTPMAVKKLSGEGIDIAPASTPNYSTSITEQTNSNASLPAGWTMSGTFTNLTNQKNIYFIASNKFWWAENGITIAPYRAWFAGPAPTSSVKAFNIVTDEETTSIHNSQFIIHNDGKFLENGKVVIIRNGKKYDTMGKRVK